MFCTKVIQRIGCIQAVLLHRSRKYEQHRKHLCCGCCSQSQIVHDMIRSSFDTAHSEECFAMHGHLSGWDPSVMWGSANRSAKAAKAKNLMASTDATSKFSALST